MKYSGIGGQAVIEGIMMQNGENYAVAVRKPDGEIEVKKDTYRSVTKKYPFLGIPFIRGVFKFADSMIVGMRALTWSCSFFEDDEDAKESRFEQWLDKVFGEKLESILMTVVMIFSFIMAIGIFMLLPMFISNICKKVIPSHTVMAILEGFIRIAIFIIYIKMVSRMEDIKRTFMYHGSEHKCINCIEHGLELNVANVRASSKEHKRCGTSFIMIVMVISILFFVVIRTDTIWLRIVSRIVLIPVIAGVSYEFLSFAGKHDSKLVDILSRPGMWMQGLTTLVTLLEAGKEKLEKAGVPDPLLDARFLLLDVFDMNFASFLVKRDRPLTGAENGINGTDADPDTLKKIEKYRELISKREMRIPLQQLTGVQEFMGLEFYVNEHVLIPRQDTETLVELVLSEHKEKNISLLDVCTGSGCIAISLAKLGGYTDVTALDLSEEALKVARSNGEKLLDQPVKFIKSDMFSALNPEKQYNVIVSNPPYIPSQVIEGLEPEVKDHEPRMALDGEPDGLKFYRILAEEGKKYLKNGGSIYMEIGWDQAKDVTEIFEAMGFSGLRTVRDMAGNDRVVCARKEK